MCLKIHVIGKCLYIETCPPCHHRNTPPAVDSLHGFPGHSDKSDHIKILIGFEHIDEMMGGTMIDYTIASVAESPLMDVFEHKLKTTKPAAVPEAGE